MSIADEQWPKRQLSFGDSLSALSAAWALGRWPRWAAVWPLSSINLFHCSVFRVIS